MTKHILKKLQVSHDFAKQDVCQPLPTDAQTPSNAANVRLSAVALVGAIALHCDELHVDHGRLLCAVQSSCQGLLNRLTARTRQVRFAVSEVNFVCPGNTGEALAEAQAKGPSKKGPSVSASDSPRVPAHASKGIDQGYF